MTTRFPVRPLALAVAHGLAACAIVIAVAVLWTWLPGDRDSALALMTVGSIGALAWTGAMLTTRSSERAPLAVNDNHPFDPLFLTWEPVLNTEATVRALLR